MATATAAQPALPLEPSSYLALPEQCYARLAPTPVAAPSLLRLNQPLAAGLGLDAEALSAPEGVALLAGNALPPRSQPIALAYAGHQFGNWVPSLGDGRAILLGELRGLDGRSRDIQLKGSGPTPFSRMGDGRAALGPVIREYVVSEATHALGIPTTRALAVVTTGETVLRQWGPEPGAVLTRVAASHLRVGTFEYFYRRGDGDALQALADYAIRRHYPDLTEAPAPYAALLERVVERTAALIAAWMGVGFIHGVMNTDNTTLSGETLDYGPCAFMDDFHPDRVFSSVDIGGRYAYNQQPRIGHWNLAQFAECLLPLLAGDEEAAVERANAALDRYPAAFEQAYHRMLRAKLGLETERDGDVDLAHALLGEMARAGADFTLTFRRLSALGARPGDGDAALRAPFEDPSGLDAWLERYRERLAVEYRPEQERRRAMRASNPAVVPRNHHVEQVIRAAQEERDLAPLDSLLAAVTHPFEDTPDTPRWAEPPAPGEAVNVTFCGT
ncbi:protein adenylyltransferase SelO [Spiribacter halobius]|uniref:Protein nucleotidyltransferase YdiU n=1 Tax=Sediminicurvatus halobius TaxID=2182432 RepID=A0A2U2N5A7_9GAMM|nr:YdiU family protein [Spiribacter halobius]PWG64356.1 YdiU family protein [Spiribacter halobius]UEX79297.1 YdiU family protein [Spiribacter halobius]